MSRKIDHFIMELVAEEMTNVKKLRKADLIDLVEKLLEWNLRELDDATIVEMYEETFHTYVRSVE
jgi:septin family protein